MTSLATQPLHVEPMTPEAFAPFGSVLNGVADRSPDYEDAASYGWRHPVEMTGSPELVVVTTNFVGTRFSKLERHIGVDQGFIAIAGVGAAVAVAAPRQVADTPPLAGDVRAFAVVPGVAYLLRAGTWHSLDRYPLSPGSIEVVMLTSIAMTDEARLADPAGWRLTQEIDYRDQGLEFQLAPGNP